LEVFTMRKVLLASSALVAAASFATASNAAAPEMTMFGSIDIQYKGESHDNLNSSGAAVANNDDLGELPFMTSIHFDVNAESDSGLAYGGRVDWRPSGNSIDELWIDVAGNWGKVVLGQDDSVADDNVPNGASALVGSFGFTGTYIAGAAAKVGGAQTNSNSGGGTSDNSKVSYYTPDFSGFGGGVSYTLDTDAGGSTGTYDSTTELAAWWSGDVSGASLTVATSYKTADANTNTNEDLGSWELGAMAGIGDFTVAANYFDNGDSGIAKTSTGDGGTGYALGVAYSFGDAAVSVGYLSTEQEDGASGTDEYENLAIDVEYTVAEGLLTYAGIQFAESTDASTSGNGHSQDSTALLLGTRLSF
jgi:hypothetical protein